MLKAFALAAALAAGGLASQAAQAAPLNAAGAVQAPALVEQAQIYFGVGPGPGYGYYGPRRYYGGPRYYAPRYYRPRYYGRPVYRGRGYGRRYYRY